mmetsp:Transcript_46861/g.151239  ORF Transcript_46861/g.151239 Transcript_46861/m.151239 type:complete len:291 (+) Transcript_46861:991-1863(+)
MLALAAHTASAVVRESPRPRTEAIDPASVGSPSAVPVPCASMRSMADGASPVASRAAVKSRRCAEPFGAVRLALRPSCRTAPPETVASEQALAAASTRTVAAPTPSLRAYPLAAASNVLHRPSTDSMPAAAAPSVGCGTSLRLTAAARAPSQSPLRAARHAPCSATSADEQAVSTLMHGPCMPSTNERRPHATDIVSPVTAYTDEGRSDESSAQSGRSMPTKTPSPPPSSDERRAPAPCSASYPTSSSSRCCGSIAATSAGGIAKKVASNPSTPTMKPPCLARSPMAPSG